MNGKLKLNDLLKLTPEILSRTKIRFNTYNGDKNPIDDFKKNLDEIIDYNKTLGCQLCGVGAMPGSARESEEGLNQFIKDANEIAARIKKEALSKKEKKIFVIGPAKATIGKINDIYRQMLYIKNEDYEQLVLIKDLIEDTGKKMGEQYPNVMTFFDFDPMTGY